MKRLARLGLRARLWSGLVLFAFAATHLLNHALGLVSLEAMEAGRRLFVGFWRFDPTELLLALAASVHAILSIWGVWQRRSLRMPLPDLLQILLGIAIPLWLIGHVLGTGILRRLTGVRDSYAFVLDGAGPAGLNALTILVLLVWLHGCIGLHRWLRLKAWYRSLTAPALALAVLLPVLALLGVLAGSRELESAFATDPGARVRRAAVERWPSEAERRALVGQPAGRIVAGYEWLILLLLAGQGGRWLVERRRTVRITYPQGLTVSVRRGMSVLEASRERGIAHASVCGGRGRCSTCRVRVGRGKDGLPPPEGQEARILARIGAPPDVRLACQLRPTHDLVVTPLMPAGVGVNAALQGMDPRAGVEREIAVLFADLRGFTRFSETRLPYDTVFVLNRYFERMGAAIEGVGGHVDKFIGDGIMALFGLNPRGTDPGHAALAAARAMAEALRLLNEELKGELAEPLRIGIGIDLGPAIVGEMGYGRAVSLTAIGDTVNVASRLEALTKEHGAELIVAERLAVQAGGLEAFPRCDVEVPGRGGRIAVRIVADARKLVVAPAAGSRRQRWKLVEALAVRCVCASRRRALARGAAERGRQGRDEQHRGKDPSSGA